MIKLRLLRPEKTIESWGLNFLGRVENELRRSTDFGFEVVDRVVDADHLLYLDCCMEHSVTEIAIQRALLERAKSSGKFASVLSFKDRPFGGLPGIYTSLETQNFDSQLHLSWPHLETPNVYVEKADVRPLDQSPWLFSFAGSCSHPLRRKLFSMFGSALNETWNVTELKRWYNHTDDEKKKYIDVINNSRFVLCPRGIACYTHRILETILLERIPVIIADDWVPFSFPENNNYYIRVKENDLGQIVSRLEQEIENYDFYLSNLRQVKSSWLSSNNRYLKSVGQFLKFHRENQRANTPDVLLARIQSSDFYRSNGLLPHQRICSAADTIVKRGKKILGW